MLLCWPFYLPKINYLCRLANALDVLVAFYFGDPIRTQSQWTESIFCAYFWTVDTICDIGSDIHKAKEYDEKNKMKRRKVLIKWKSLCYSGAYHDLVIKYHNPCQFIQIQRNG